MTETEFLSLLSKTPGQYKWAEKNGKIVATGRNHVSKDVTFNPISAVKRFTRRKNLNISPEMEQNIWRAITAKSNHGYTQVLRGRIKKAVGLA